MARQLEPAFLERLQCLNCRSAGESEDQGPTLKQGGDRNDWVICGQCGYRYPIQDGFPVMIESKGVAPDAGS